MKYRLVMLMTFCIISLSINNLNASVSERKIFDCYTVTCDRCQGTGWEVCPVCSGAGIQIYDILGNKTFPALDSISIVCTRCHGSGRIVCTLCNGTGILQKSSK